MKHLMVVVFCFGLFACQRSTQNDVQLKSQKDSISYSIGLNIGNNLKSQMIDIEPNIVAQGIKDIVDSNKTLLTEDQAQAVITAFQQQMMAKHEQVAKEQAEKNIKIGEAFLAENKKKEGVVTLPNGLQYKVIKMGTGKKPKATDTITVNYRGTLINGTEFDNSFKRGQPWTAPLNSFIPGWIEAVQLMPVGSNWEIYVPPQLAYGERGAGQIIQPNSTLFFEIELLAIK